MGGGSSHASGIVKKKTGICAKQPNSATRKAVIVELKKNHKVITAFVPKDGCSGYINEKDEVLISGLGRSGHSVGDLHGVRFKVIAVKKEDKEKKKHDEQTQRKKKPFLSLNAIYKGK